MVREIGRFDGYPVASEALLDACIESARSLGLQVWIAEKTRRGLYDWMNRGSLMPRPALARMRVAPRSPLPSLASQAAVSRGAV